VIEKAPLNDTLMQDCYHKAVPKNMIIVARYDIKLNEDTHIFNKE